MLSTMSSFQHGSPIPLQPGSNWSTRNTVLLCMSIGAFLGAILVFLFGVVLTSGVYGSRIAWLLGVSVPLLAIAAVLARGSSKRVIENAGREGEVGKPNRVDGVKTAKSIAGVS
jgi:high-affinity Fe2+/Pb2+ permease